MRLHLFLLLAGSGLLVQAASLPSATGMGLLTGKLYVAEISGVVTAYSDGVIVKAEQTNAFNALGLMIRTGKNSWQASVFSNGTGIFIDNSTHIEVLRFAQERFAPNRMDLTLEPSVSASDIFVSGGLLGACTSRLLSGSSVRFSTRQAVATVTKYARMAVRAEDHQSGFYLLEGDCAVSPRNGTDLGHRVMLQPGEMVTFREGEDAGLIEPISPKRLAELEGRVSLAFRARMAVMFDESTAAGVDTPVLKAYPIVPANLPPGIEAVSPAFLR